MYSLFLLGPEMNQKIRAPQELRGMMNFSRSMDSKYCYLGMKEHLSYSPSKLAPYTKRKLPVRGERLENSRNQLSKLNLNEEQKTTLTIELLKTEIQDLKEKNNDLLEMNRKLATLAYETSPMDRGDLHSLYNQLFAEEYKKEVNSHLFNNRYNAEDVIYR